MNPHPAILILISIVAFVISRIAKRSIPYNKMYLETYYSGDKEKYPQKITFRYRFIYMIFSFLSVLCIASYFVVKIIPI